MLDKGDKYEKENWFSCGNYFYRGFSFWYFKGSSKPVKLLKHRPKPFGVSFRNVVLAVLKLFPVTLCLMDFITRMILDIGLEQKMGIILYFI